MNAYGTSIGHILLESIDELSGSISSGPISEKISLDSPVRSLEISVCQLEIFILAKTDNGFYLVTLPQLGSSLSCKHHIRKVGFFADEISCSKNKFVWREGNTVFAGNFCLPDEKFKHWTLLHSRSEIIQMELKDEICLIGGRDCLMTCCLSSGEITVLLDVPTFAPFITGACFTSNFAIAACDDSGGIKIVSQNGEILHEVDFGYQSGFKPGRLRYHLATLVSFEYSSVTFIDFLENSMDQVPIRGKICDLTCSKREIIGVISGQAMKLRKNEENTDLKKIESAGRCRTDSDIVDVDEAFRSAKGLFFALKKKMKDKIIVSKPVVDKMSESVKHIANNVGSKISKEIFDDEIFESDNLLVPPQMAQVCW